jgi:gas vesicle protein
MLEVRAGRWEGLWTEEGTGMMHREESRHDFAFIAGVIVGAVSGALVTLALTPMSGTETREKLKERVGDLEPVKERAAGVATSAQHLMETSRERAADLVAKSPLPFGGPHGEAVDTVSDTSLGTGQGGGAHTMEPAEGSVEAVEGNGLAAATDDAEPARATDAATSS